MVIQILFPICCIVTCALLGACYGGNDWLILDNMDMTIGLWKICCRGECKGLYGVDAASKFKVPVWFQAVKGLAVASAAFSVGGVVVVTLSMTFQEIKVYWASVFHIPSALCMIIALWIFTSADLPDMGSDTKFGFSYILGWIGVIAASVTAFIGMSIKVAGNRSNRFTLIVEEVRY